MGPTILVVPVLNLCIICDIQGFKIPGPGQGWKHAVTNCHYVELPADNLEWPTYRQAI